jgi:chromosome segregation ATPase
LFFKSEIENFKSEVENKLKTNHKVEIEQLNESISEKDNYINQLNIEIEKLRAEYEQRKTEIEKLNITISEKDKTINQLEYQIKENNKSKTENKEKHGKQEESDIKNLQPQNNKDDIVCGTTGTFFSDEKFSTNLTKEQLEKLSMTALKKLAKEMKVPKYSTYKENTYLIAEILKHASK